MTNAAHTLVTWAMERAILPQTFTSYAPSNIALSKYWGKRDKHRNLPLNSSLSISLADWGTKTTVAPSTDDRDRIWLNGAEVPCDDSFAIKALAFVRLFRANRQIPLHIKTENSLPTAAGLASSASGFAALTQALNGAFGLELSLPQQSMIARLGSGSACRSLWHGFVRWDRGIAEDGHDSLATPMDVIWPEFRIGVVAVDTGPKAQSSRNGMNHTAETSPLFQSWPEAAEADCAKIEASIIAHDFVHLGQLAEANALAMHATMMAARPSLSYLNAQSWAVLDRLWRARQDGLQAYATMDAGANIKLLFLEASTEPLQEVFPDVQVIEPFGLDLSRFRAAPSARLSPLSFESDGAFSAQC
jgi:diphosphomevalonate decarboxylase